jgi:hypothetical protein
MNKHTAGPWHINGFFSDTGVPAAISGAGGEPIVSLHRINPDTEANARLIAAAPELLAIVKALDSEAIMRVHNQLPTLNVDDVLSRIEGEP